MTESHVLVCSGDQAGNIRDCRPPVTIELDNADHRVQRREWIRGYLGMGRGNPPEQGRLPGIWVADKTNVGNLAKFQKEKTFFSRVPLSELPWRTVSRTFEMRVPLTSRAPPAQNQFLILLRQISDQLTICRGDNCLRRRLVW